MKQWKIGQKLALIVYSIGVLCVIVLSAGYLRRSTEVTNPDAMLPLSQYEACVLLLLFGLPFLLAACVMLCILFSQWSVRRKISVFLPLLVAVGIVGFEFGSELLTPEEPVTQFQVAVVLDTDSEIYSLSGDIYLDGDIIGGQTCCDAKEKPFKRGETICLSILPEDVPEGCDLSKLTMKVSVMLESPDHGTAYKVENGSVTATEWNETVTLTVSGNAEQGFVGVRN